MLTSNFYGRLNSTESFDLQAAKVELAKVPSGLLNGAIKANWFSGRSSLTPNDKRIVDSIKGQLRKLDLDIVFGPTSHPTFSETDAENVFRIDDRGTAFPDPLVIFRADNAELKRYLTDAAKAQSLDVKANAIFALSKYFSDNSILIPLYERKTVYWINPNKVADLGVQTGITFDVERIRLIRRL